MTRKEQLLALADRVEALDGPCGEVNAEIMGLFFNLEERHIGSREGWGDETFEDCLPVKDRVWVDPKTDKWVSTHARFFTASIDAAMTLVPEGWGYTLVTPPPDHRPWASVREWRPDDKGKMWTGKHMASSGEVAATTPALALTAAALRAQAEIEQWTPPAQSFALCCLPWPCLASASLFNGELR